LGNRHDFYAQFWKKPIPKAPRIPRGLGTDPWHYFSDSLKNRIFHQNFIILQKFLVNFLRKFTKIEKSENFAKNAKKSRFFKKRVILGKKGHFSKKSEKTAKTAFLKKSKNGQDR